MKKQLFREWKWCSVEPPNSDWSIKEWLMWNGMVFGSVEQFGHGMSFYGNVGTGHECLERTGAVGTLAACRKRVEEMAGKLLSDAFQV